MLDTGPGEPHPRPEVAEISSAPNHPESKGWADRWAPTSVSDSPMFVNSEALTIDPLNPDSTFSSFIQSTFPSCFGGHDGKPIRFKVLDVFMGELDIFCPVTGTERGRGLIRMSHGCNLMERHRKLATLTDSL